MRVVADAPSLLDDLAHFLERLGCEVEWAAEGLEVSIPFVPDDKAERVLRVFLANWRGGAASLR